MVRIAQRASMRGKRGVWPVQLLVDDHVQELGLVVRFTVVRCFQML